MKTNFDKLFKTDKNLETKGVEMEIEDGVAFLIRAYKSSNPRVKAAVAKYYKPYARQIDLGTLTPEKEIELDVKAFIEISLAGWRGVEIDGAPAEFNFQTAVELLTEYPDLFKQLQEFARDSKNYRPEDEVGEDTGDIEDVGNSSLPT